jgi:hypothetical protein
MIDNFLEGIDVRGTSNTRIEGNFIGTEPADPSGVSNVIGVKVEGDSITPSIGGSTPDKRNVISGNAGGIVLVKAHGAVIRGNYVGTDESGTKRAGNSDGISVNSSSDATIGGTTVASGNVLSGNNATGLTIGGDSQGTRVLGNRIGTPAAGSGALGNLRAGIWVLNSSDTSIGNGTTAGSNTIAFNGTDGVQVEALYPGQAVGNHVFANSIFSNGDLGIDLRNDGNTANDLGDLDKGPNNSQNKPLIDSAKNASGKTTIKGKLNSASNRTYLIQFYSNPAGGDEGKK